MGRFLEALARALQAAFALPFVFAAWAIKEMREYGQQVSQPPEPEQSAAIAGAVAQVQGATRSLALARWCARYAREALDGGRPSSEGAPPHVARWLRTLSEAEMEKVAMASSEDLRDHLNGTDPLDLTPVPWPAGATAPAPAAILPLPGRAMRGGGMLAHQDNDHLVYRMAM